MTRIPFSVELAVPVMGVARRSGWLVKGRAGWGEVSPLPSWSPAECDAAEKAAVEAADLEFPEMQRAEVEVNALVPRLPPDVAARLAFESGCVSIKVKVGDEHSVDRVAAVRSACGSQARLRVDANGAWTLDSAAHELERLSPFDIELAEDPVGSLEDLTALRLKVRIPLAAEASVRTVADARRLHRLDAADAVVLKPQRLGGVRAALLAAEAAGVPAIASSALETSVGLSAVLALAAALPDTVFAHGCGTALLLAEDVATDRLVPRDGRLHVRRVTPDLVRAAAP